MKNEYAYAFLAIILGLAFASNPIKVFPLNQAGIFITILGIVFGIIAAFTISSSSTRFNGIRDAIASELNSIVGIGTLSKRFSDRKSFEKIRYSLVDYIKEILKLKKGNSNRGRVYKSLRAFTSTVAAAKISNSKDGALFSSIQADIRVLSSARESQMFLLDERVSATDWVLNLFLSAALIFMIMLVQIQLSYILSFLLISTAVISILLILVTIYHLDALPISDERLVLTPYEENIEVLNEL